MNQIEMNRQLLKEMYCNFLPIMLMPSTTLGMIIGIGTNHTPETKKPIDMLVNTIGYTSIGIFTGFTFPISIPLIGGYIIYRDIIKK